MQTNEYLTPDSIRNIANSFQQSRIILTAIELEIFTVLDKHLMQSEDVAQKINCDPRAVNRLMNALVALGFLRKVHGKFYNTETSAKYLIKGKPEYMGNLDHTNNLWDSWSTLTEAVRHGKSVLDRPRKNDNREDFIAAMHYRAQREAKIISLMLDLNNVNKMLDIGGGSGAFTYEFMSVNPNMKGVIFDLPNIIPITKKYADQYQLGNRLNFIEGDYLVDQFGNGYDLILLSAIVHINSYEQNKELIKKCSDSLNAGGQIIIRDFIMNDDRTEPANAAMFSLNMLVGTEYGDTYTESEMKEWFINSGINQVIRKDTGFGSNLLIGIKK
ncbi:MAG: acetylserotonin O-methyltransferase [Ignavibacteria bacterium]|nr:acetylserotonin O-methyltransferase [Ignavibacteria bacterium]